MPVDLQDENTQPNPIIRKLIHIGNELQGLAMGEKDTWPLCLYGSAMRSVHDAISCLMEAKNTIAREQGEDA